MNPSSSHTPLTDAIGIDHLTATEREYKLRKLAMKLERENVKLRKPYNGSSAPSLPLAPNERL